MTQDVVARIAASHPPCSRRFSLPDRGTRRTILVDTPTQPHYTHAHPLSGVTPSKRGGLPECLHAAGWRRRCFLGGLTLAGAAGLLGQHARPVTAEPPPETMRLRLPKPPGICIAPQYVAEKFLHLEGFTDVHEVAATDTIEAYKASPPGPSTSAWASPTVGCHSGQT